MINIDWSIYKKTYGGEIGYRLPLVDEGKNITILVLKQSFELDTYGSWELNVYPHQNPVHNTYWFDCLSKAQHAIVDSMKGVENALSNDDLSGMSLVLPIGLIRGDKCNKRSVRNVRSVD